MDLLLFTNQGNVYKMKVFEIRTTNHPTSANSPPTCSAWMRVNELCSFT
jgi:hypothetical protein